MKRIILPLVSMALFTMIQCSKSDPAPANQTVDLISKNWKLTGLNINGQDVYPAVDDCEKDNLFIFTKEGKYTVDEGTTKCSSSDPQVIEMGSYAFLQNNTMLKFTISDGSSYTVAVNQLTATMLKTTLTDNTGGNNTTLISTYTAQ